MPRPTWTRPSGSASQPLLSLDGVAAGYGGEAVIRDVDLTLAPGQRVGILGRNGAGKSTLVKLVAGVLSPLAGRREAHPDLATGYFAQHQMELLREEESALAQLLRETGLGEQQGRDLLGRYGFSGDDANRPVGTFSGGERARLVLALIFQRRPNLLLLDEPTNHLDLEMRHALGLALQDYPGAIVLVSHDRHLLETTADELWVVRDGAVMPWDGDLAGYARWLRRSRDEAAPAGNGAGAPAAAPGGGERAAPARAGPRKLSYHEQRELEALPSRIEDLESTQRELHATLADPDFYRQPGERIAALREELALVERELEGSFARWDELEAMTGS